MKIKRFSFLKTVVTFVVAIVAVIGLASCGDNNQKLVDEALESLEIGYTGTETSTTVKGKLTLPTKSGDITISWVSDKPNVVSTAGVVVRGDADITVKLTATLKLGNVEETKHFTITVKAKDLPTPLEVLAAVALDGDFLLYDKEKDTYSTREDIVLPTEVLGIQVTWTSTNPALISVTGEVTRPVWGQEDQAVVLTAKVGEEEKQFVVTVQAVAIKPASAKVADAKDLLLLQGTSDGVVDDLDLPDTAGSEGVQVTWISSNPNIIGSNGEVNRQSENVTVTLTAVLFFEGYSDEKEFEVVVIAAEPSVEVADFAGAKALYTTNQALPEKPYTYVEVKGVTVVGVTKDGYLIYDGVDLFFVFTKGAPKASIKAGNVYDIVGLVDYYFGAWQFNGTTVTKYATITRPSEAVAQTPDPKEVLDVEAYIASLPTAAEITANGFPYEAIEITAKVLVQGSGNYDVFLVNPLFDGKVNSAASSPFTTDALMIYYQSNIAALRAFNGQKVKLVVYLYSLRTDRNIFTFLFTGDEADITVVPLTDKEMVASAKSQIPGLFPQVQIEGKTFELPATLSGADIAWSSSNEDVINSETGVVTPHATDQIAVTLTATITKGTETDTIAVIIKVGIVPLSTVEEVVALEAGDEVIRVIGVVTASEFYRTYFIQQGDAGIAVYTSNAALLAILKANLGKQVEVIGKRAEHNGLRQIAPLTGRIKAVEGGTMPEEVNVDAVSLTAEGMIDYQGRLVEFTNLIIKKVEKDTYDNVIITFERIDGSTIQMKWDSRTALSTEAAALLATIVVGKKVDIVNPLAWNNVPYLYFTDSTEVVVADLTNQDKVALDHAALVIPTKVTVAGDMKLPAAGTNGSVITWVSGNADVITNAGIVTLPTAKTIVTLTATITIDTTSLTKAFQVEVFPEGYVEVVVYETGFEAPDFTAATAYNQPEKAVGPAGEQWAVRYGTPSTTTPIIGTQSMQMRWYRAASGSHTTDPIYTFTKFATEGATKVTFFAANNGKGSNVEVTISVDGGATWIAPKVFTLTNTSTEYTYDVPAVNQSGDVQFKFTIVVANPMPSEDDRLYLDGVKIYALEGGEPAPETVTVKAINAGGSTFNATVDVNYAENLGLNKDIFTVTFNAGSASNNTAIRTEGGWRMYYHADGGNFMTVDMADGYTIESIILEISTNKATGDAITFRVNDTSVTEEGIVGNKFTNDGLGTNWRVLDSIEVNANSFVLENMNTVNVQLWVWSIEITYSVEA